MLKYLSIIDSWKGLSFTMNKRFFKGTNWEGKREWIQEARGNTVKI